MDLARLLKGLRSPRKPVSEPGSQAFDRLPDVRKDKVERLKERIESGSRIDSKKLAQELLKYLGSTGEADGD